MWVTRLHEIFLLHTLLIGLIFLKVHVGHLKMMPDLSSVTEIFCEAWCILLLTPPRVFQATTLKIQGTEIDFE